MSLSKVTYVDGVTVISAANLNAIQDAIISLEQGGGSSITIDSALSNSSTNPVQNKVITTALATKGTYSKPSGGIPASDLAPGVIPTVPSAATSAPANIGAAAVGSSSKYAKADHVHDYGSDFVTALLQLAEKVAYIDGNGQTYYQALYDALNHVVTYTVTNTLSGCTSSNAAGTATAESPYQATITASAGYTLTGATVSVTMDGNDITSTAYNNGTISIASVSGNIVIAVTAVAVTLSSISAVYTQSGAVYATDSLDSLKTDLVVTAHYSDSSTDTVAAADYTLSGTLTVGTSTITVSYDGKTTTFTVTVTDQSRLPSEYQEVAWIGAEKGPVIDTLAVLSTESEIEGSFKFLGQGTAQYSAFFGKTSPSVLAMYGSNSYLGVNFGYPSSKTINSALTSGAFNKIVMNKTKVYVNDVDKGGYSGSMTTEFSQRHLLIFAWPNDDNNTPTREAWAQCEYFKIRDNGNLVADLVPCYRKSDSVIGMYDLVANEFRTNVGTGTFTKGDDVA